MSYQESKILLEDIQGRRKVIELDTVVASGGAGTVYTVRSDKTIVVKIYHSETIKHEGSIYASKLEKMLKNVPNVTSTNELVQIAWPLALAKDINNNFIGFAMRAINFSRSESLESMLMPKIAERKKIRSGLEARVVVSANLSRIVNKIHEQGHYIVDLKPPNLRLYREELYVAVLDCDGFHINISDQNIQAPQVTPEYLAPEFHGKVIDQPELQDRFALAVIIFRLLNSGIHPYDGIISSSSAPTERGERISNRLYAYGLSQSIHVKPLPISAHFYFPLKLRQYFDRAFNAKSFDRPSSSEWANLLSEIAQTKNKLMSACENGHIWFANESCGMCARQRILGFINPSNDKTKQMNKFDLSKIWSEISSVSPPPEYKHNSISLIPAPKPIPIRIKVLEKTNIVFIIINLIVFVYLIYNYSKTSLSDFFTCFISFVFWVICYYASGLDERKKRFELLSEAKIKYESLLDEVSNKDFENYSNELRTLIDDYNKIDIIMGNHIEQSKEERKRQMFLDYLAKITLKPGIVEGIGANLIRKLNDEGIFNAYDVSYKDIDNISGFGDSRKEALRSWISDISQAFVFNSNDCFTTLEMDKLKQPFYQKKAAIENRLTSGKQDLNRIRESIILRRKDKENHIQETAKELKQKQVDFDIMF